MKQELMTALNNDEMQNKWKTCIHMTCIEYRAKQMKEFYDGIIEAMRQFVERVKNAFKKLVDSLSELRSDIQVCQYQYRVYKSYPHSFPQYVNNLKVNIKGYPRPVMRCARSRCK